MSGRNLRIPSAAVVLSTALCKHECLVALSCKRRGFCPSCGVRRMAECATLLVDEVLPAIPIRQWVLSFAYQLCLLLAQQPAMMGKVLKLTG